MWTITDEQLEKINQSMKEELENRIMFQLVKDEHICKYSRYYVQDTIHEQIELANSFEITREDLVKIFVEHSFKYRILREKGFDEKIMAILSSNHIDEVRKVQRLVNHLNSNNYESDF